MLSLQPAGTELLKYVVSECSHFFSNLVYSLEAAVARGELPQRSNSYKELPKGKEKKEVVRRVKRKPTAYNIYVQKVSFASLQSRCFECWVRNLRHTWSAYRSVSSSRQLGQQTILVSLPTCTSAQPEPELWERGGGAELDACAANFSLAAASWKGLSEEQKKAYTALFLADNSDPNLDKLPEPEEMTAVAAALPQPGAEQVAPQVQGLLQ